MQLRPFDDVHHQDKEFERFRFRTAIASIAVLLALSLIFGRLFWLQVAQHDYYSTRAEGNRISLVPIVPNRGVIIDRQGIVLARNQSAFTLELTPSKISNLDDTIDALAQLIEIQPKDRRNFRKLLAELKSFASIPLRTRLTDEEVAIITANRYRFPGVEVQARLFRQYPEGALAAHALGYIGRTNAEDIERIADRDETSNYKGTDHFGKTGIEQHYEFELHGKTGHERVEVDKSGRAVRSLTRTAPIPGNNLTLTLDAKLQKVVEQAFGERRGALVAIEPETGGILAFVSMPSFDPNLFVDGIRVDDWDAYNNDPDKPLLNRAIRSAYPPGSTFKPFMALAALESGKRTPQQAIADPGFFNFGNHTFMDDKRGGHGMVDMYKSIVLSCNTYYYMLANDLGIDGISGFMSKFGFGERTGIDLEGESEGALPSQAWKKKRFRKPEQQKWFAGETISVGIGQGYNAYTMLQLANATATLANNGVMFRPHLVKYITDARTGEKTMVEPEPVRDLKLRQQNIDVIKKALAGVTREGTGARAFAGAEYQAAGKTGTAQVFSLRGEKYVAGRLNERRRDHALFMAFAPVDKPRIALAVIVENSGFGAQSAAPIARMVFDYYLQGKVPEGAAKEDPEAEEGD